MKKNVIFYTQIVHCKKYCHVKIRLDSGVVVKVENCKILKHVIRVPI